MLDSGVTTSIRGLHAVDANTCWLGTKGGVARTVDAGKTWRFFKIAADSEELDFRDVEAFDAKRCVAMSAGEGAASRIYLTVDGGESWKLVFQNREPKGFFNGMAFREDGHGVLAGDPVGGRLFLLATEDRGATWRRLAKDSAPKMADGEHAFAASGTHLTASGDRILVTSGGRVARVFVSSDWGENWKVQAPLVIAGEPSTGIFSIAVSPSHDRSWIVVGGDYEKEAEGKKNACRTTDAGGVWEEIHTPYGGSPFHFRSCVRWVDSMTLIATGPSGSNISRDGGSTWKALGGEDGFHTVSVAAGVAWAAGAEGRVGRLLLKK
jgi:photosystem II stability/assembly factor-like uncharacterized protein